MKSLRFKVAKTGYLLLFLGLTLLQVFSFPGAFQHMRRMHGFSLLLEILLISIVGVWIFCGQGALICLWRITEFMREGQFFSTGNIVWIARLLRTFKIAAVIPVILIMILAPQADDPGFFVILAMLTLFFFSLTVTTSLLKDEITGKASD